MNNERELQTIGGNDVGNLNDVLGSQIDPAAVTAQTASSDMQERVAQVEAILTGEATTETVDTSVEQSEGQQERLGFDEHWINTREGNNKKWRDPAKEKRVKKIAAASRRRNRRK